MRRLLISLVAVLGLVALFPSVASLQRARPGSIEEVKSGSNGGSHQPDNGSAKMKIGDICPECGEAAVVNEEGCRKCYACGFSEC